MGKDTARRRKLPFLYQILKPFEKHRLQRVAELIEGSDLKVLEIGCADGKFLYENRYRWESIVGVDIVSKYLEKARKRKYGVPEKFQKVDVGRQKLPYKDKTFDLVVSIATLQYVYDLDLLFDEVRRVLKSKGTFIFEVPNLAVFWRRIELLCGKLPRTSLLEYSWDAGVIHYFTYVDLARFTNQKGFTIEKVSCSGIFSELRQIWPSFLGADLIYVCRIGISKF